MRRRRAAEARRCDFTTQMEDHVIAPDGLIPNSVIRAKLKGLSNAKVKSNTLNHEVSVNLQLPLKTTTLAERKPEQQTSETTSSASTFYWESDPDDERIGPRAKEIAEEALPGPSNYSDVVQPIEDSSGTSEFQASAELRILTGERGTPGGCGREPDAVRMTDEESRNSEELWVEKYSKLETHENEFSHGNYPENLPSTNSGLDVGNFRRISTGEGSGKAEKSGRCFQFDTEMVNPEDTIKQGSSDGDDERREAMSDPSSCVALENDDDKKKEEKDADALFSVGLGVEELREDEERWKPNLRTDLENIPPSDEKPVECLFDSAEGPNNQNDRPANYDGNKRKLPRQMKKINVSSDKAMQGATGHVTSSCQVINIPSADKWMRGRLLPNNPAMYRMYKKRDQMLSAVH